MNINETNIKNSSIPTKSAVPQENSLIIVDLAQRKSNEPSIKFDNAQHAQLKNNSRYIVLFTLCRYLQEEEKSANNVSIQRIPEIKNKHNSKRIYF